METVQYEWDGRSTSREDTLTRLKNACAAFLLDAATRKDIHTIGLIVEISPIVCDVLAETIEAKDGGRREKKSNARRQEDRFRAFDASTERVNNVLSLALADAKVLSAWIVEQGLSPRCSSAPVSSSASSSSPAITAADRGAPRILLIAHLSPKSWPEWELYRTWQLQDGAVARSPLRHAALVSLQLDQLTLHWAAHGGSKGDGTRGVKASRYELADLLLPYQQLLLDITWAVLPPFLPLHHRVTDEHDPLSATSSSSLRQGRGGSGMGKSAMIFSAFFDVVLPQLVAPKGRCGVFLRYSRLLPFLLRARAELTADRNSPKGESDDSVDEREEDHLLDSGLPRPRELIAMQRQFQRILDAIYQGEGAIGKNCVLRWVISFGGPVQALLCESRCGEDDHGDNGNAKSSPSRNPDAISDNENGNESSFIVPRPHQTRRLRDVHALLSLLMGSYSGTTGLEEAVQFCRRLCTRVERNEWIPHVIQRQRAKPSRNVFPAVPLLSTPSSSPSQHHSNAATSSCFSITGGAAAFLAPFFSDPSASPNRTRRKNTSKRSTASAWPGSSGPVCSSINATAAAATAAIAVGQPRPIDTLRHPKSSTLREESRGRDKKRKRARGVDSPASSTVFGGKEEEEVNAMGGGRITREAKRHKQHDDQQDRSSKVAGLWTTDLNPTARS